MKKRFAIQQEIEQLDPQRDCQRIVYLMGAYEHPWLTRKSLEFALFRTYAVPSISGLLQATGQFQQHGQKRYDDTSLLIASISEQGYESEFGRQAIERMNYWHNQYKIQNDDFLYVLSVFIFEPIRWIDRFGWRPTTELEREASYNFWVQVGKRMNIANLPSSYQEFEAFNIDYEQQNFVFAQSNNVIGEATIQVFLHWYPVWMRPSVRQGIYALLDDPLRIAFGFPKASALLRRLLPILLNLRKFVLRMMPPRRTPYHFTELPNRTYPHGHQISSLGPDEPGAQGGT